MTAAEQRYWKRVLVTAAIHVAAAWAAGLPEEAAELLGRAEALDPAGPQTN